MASRNDHCVVINCLSLGHDFFILFILSMQLRQFIMTLFQLQRKVDTPMKSEQKPSTAPRVTGPIQKNQVRRNPEFLRQAPHWSPFQDQRKNPQALHLSWKVVPLVLQINNPCIPAVTILLQVVTFQIAALNLKGSLKMMSWIHWKLP